MNSSTASAEVKRDSTLAFFFGWEISVWIAKDVAEQCAALELAAAEESAGMAEELAAEKSGAFLAGSGDSNLCIFRWGLDNRGIGGNGIIPRPRGA